MAANKYGSYPTSRKQLRQRKLAWALKITMGALVNIRHNVPDDCESKRVTVSQLVWLVQELRDKLRNIV